MFFERPGPPKHALDFLRIIRTSGEVCPDVTSIPESRFRHHLLNDSRTRQEPSDSESDRNARNKPRTGIEHEPELADKTTLLLLLEDPRPIQTRTEASAQAASRHSPSGATLSIAAHRTVSETRTPPPQAGSRDRVASTEPLQKLRPPHY